MLKFIIVSIIFCLPNFSFSQEYPYSDKTFSDVSVQVGISGYAGDLGGALGTGRLKNITTDLFKSALSVNGTYKISSLISIKPSLTFARVTGDDNLYADDNLSKRNLSFRSGIAELAVLADINPLAILPGYSEVEHSFLPYLSIGAGAFYFKPKTNYFGVYYDLRPLSLEGQGFDEYPDRKPYSQIQLNIPFGGGFKYYISANNYVGVDGLIRRTFTDYLDDVSTTYIDSKLFDKYLSPEKATLAKQLYFRDDRNTGLARGNPNSDDYFFTFSLRFGFVLNNENY